MKILLEQEKEYEEEENQLNLDIEKAVREKGINTCITVCDNCLQASCWQAIFMCWESQNAGTVVKTIGQLAGLKLEHPDYWKTDKELARL